MDVHQLYRQATDAEIWADFLRGSKEAYAFMYEKYVRALYNYGYKIAQSRQLTEDCIQDVFLTILESRERLSQTDSIKFYLMKALRREIVRRLSVAQRFDSEPDVADILDFKIGFHYEPSWLDNQISKERSAALLQELNRLPARQKEALFLRFFDNLSYEEIAGIMNIDLHSAYKVIYKAIASLQKRLQPNLLLWLLTLSQSG